MFIPFEVDEMMENFKLLPPGQGAIMFMRHSIRYELPSNDAYGFHIDLTPNGVEVAKKMGEVIPYPISFVTSSPLQRCQNTARLISGIDDVYSEELIGATSAYLLDLDLAGEYQKQFGPFAMINDFLRGKVVPGLADFKSSNEAILQLFKSQDIHDGMLNLFVSHDSVIAPWVYSVIGRDEIEEKDWPQVLESTLFWFADDKIYLIWRGKLYVREIVGLFDK